VRWIIFLYPWLELWTLIWLGRETSALVAMGWVLAALMLGGALMRRAGQNSLQRLAQVRAEGSLVQELVAADMAQIFAGLLLAVPGLVSDVLAVMVLIRPLRALIFGRWVPRPENSASWSAYRGAQDGVIEGEFSVKDGGTEPPRQGGATSLEPPKSP
jgi:UPF0716 protein FxsA